MSLSTLAPAADDFDRWETELTQPLGEPEPPPQPHPRRGARGDERRAAIAESLGIVRHRSSERGV